MCVQSVFLYFDMNAAYAGIKYHVGFYISYLPY